MSSYGNGKIDYDFETNRLPGATDKKDFQEINPPRNDEEFYATYNPRLGWGICFGMSTILVLFTLKMVMYKICRKLRDLKDEGKLEFLFRKSAPKNEWKNEKDLKIDVEENFSMFSPSLQPLILRVDDLRTFSVDDLQASSVDNLEIEFNKFAEVHANFKNHLPPIPDDNVSENSVFL